MKDKIIIVPTPEKARKLSQDHITPNIKTDKFCQGPLGVSYEPTTMKCPCCGSDDTSGARTACISVICWDCYALFRQLPDGSIQIDECMCGRHDDGRIIKAISEEVASHDWGSRRRSFK